jgi:hypothetical protein
MCKKLMLSKMASFGEKQVEEKLDDDSNPEKTKMRDALAALLCDRNLDDAIKKCSSDI